MRNNQILNIANSCDVKRRVNSLKNRSSDIKVRLGPILKKLWNPERIFLAVSSQIDFGDLRQNFPQFGEVIDFYEDTVRTLAKLDAAFEISPILLQGDPGLGKTYFASELARTIGLQFYEISLATTTASFALSGGSTQWSEGSPGFVCNTLAESEYINPFILIDEIDKCSGSTSYDPLNAFYGLLESHSAKRFRDEALEIQLDASKIVWMATSNYLDNIPVPLKSRMRIFQINQSSPKQMEIVVRKIYEQMINTKPYGSLLSKYLNDDVVKRLSTKNPREVKLAIEESSYKALRADRAVIKLNDLPNDRSKYHVGFV